MKIHVCRLDCQIDHVAEAAAGDGALQHVALGYLARAEKAEAEVERLRAGVEMLNAELLEARSAVIGSLVACGYSPGHPCALVRRAEARLADALRTTAAKPTEGT